MLKYIDDQRVIQKFNHKTNKADSKRSSPHHKHTNFQEQEEEKIQPHTMRFSTSNKITEKSFEGCVTNAHHLPLGKSFSLVISNSRELDMVLQTPMYDVEEEHEDQISSSSSSSSSQRSHEENFAGGSIPTMIEINSVVNDEETEDFKDKIRSQIMLRKRKALKKTA